MTAIKNPPMTAAEVSAIFSLREDGNLVWKVSANNWRRCGDLAGSKKTDKNGRPSGIYVGINYRVVMAHRLVWLLTYGEWPKGVVDHINGNPYDNRPSNLRIATAHQNCHNRRARRGKGLPKGVTFHKAAGKYQAAIGANGERHYLGLYSSIDDAAEAYAAAAQKMHGDFACTASADMARSRTQ